MEKFEVKEITNKTAWEEFVLSKKPKTFLQSWNWGETNIYAGYFVVRFGLFKEGKLVAVAQLIEQKAKRGPHFLIPGGPVIDWKDRKSVNFFLEFLKKYSKEKGAWFFRIRPDIEDNDPNRKLFDGLGFKESPMHLHAQNTWILDISSGEEEILKGMRKSTRYLVKKGITADFELKKTIEPKFADVLSRLQVDTSRRHKFVGFSQKLFEGQLATFGKDGQAELFICKQGKKEHCAAIIIYYGDTAYYHHSASTDESKKIPIAYFLQWNVIKSAREKGLKFYNFWGVAPDDNPKHRFAGVTLFKKGFGGFQVDYLHARDFPLSPLYNLTRLFELGRKMLRHL